MKTDRSYRAERIVTLDLFLQEAAASFGISRSAASGDTRGGYAMCWTERIQLHWQQAGYQAFISDSVGKDATWSRLWRTMKRR